MPRLDRRAAPALFNAYLQPERSGRRARRDRAEDAQAIAQDYLQYMRSDYEQRRSHGRRSWRDLYPAYAFALTTHYADWPRGADDTDGELAEQDGGNGIGAVALVGFGKERTFYLRR